MTQVLPTHDSVKTCSNSGVLAADAAVKSGAGVVYWLTVNDAADLAIELNDSADDSGTDLWAMKLDVDVVNFAHFVFDPPIYFGTGIWLDVSTATCQVIIGYA